MKFYTAIVRDRNELVVRGYSDLGKRVVDRVPFKPVLFVPTNEETEFKTHLNVPVTPREYESMSKATQATKDNKHIVGQNRFPYQYINRVWGTDVQYNPEFIKIAFIDIETEAEESFPDIETALERINLITVMIDGAVTTFGFTPWTQDDSRTKIDVKVNYVLCNDEEDLLNQYCAFMNKVDVDIITGWNLSGFDTPYIAKRLDVVFGEGGRNALSPLGRVEFKDTFKNNREAKVVVIDGIAEYDYLDLYKKFGGNLQPSYKLDDIAFVELKEKKVDYSEHDSFKAFYTNDWGRFVDYNIVDTLLVKKLDDKKKLIKLGLGMTYGSQTLPSDVFAPVRMLDSTIVNIMGIDKVILPLNKAGADDIEDEQFEGAFVKNPVPGKYGWIIASDVASMYPHNIAQWGLSPENLDFLSEEEHAEIMTELFSEYTEADKSSNVFKYLMSTGSFKKMSDINIEDVGETTWNHLSC